MRPSPASFDLWLPASGGLAFLLQGGGSLEITRAGLDLYGWRGREPADIADELAKAKAIAFVRMPAGPYLPMLRVSVLAAATLRAPCGMATGAHFHPELVCDRQWGCA